MLYDVYANYDQTWRYICTSDDIDAAKRAAEGTMHEADDAVVINRENGEMLWRWSEQ